MIVLFLQVSPVLVSGPGTETHSISWGTALPQCTHWTHKKNWWEGERVWEHHAWGHHDYFPFGDSSQAHPGTSPELCTANISPLRSGSLKQSNILTRTIIHLCIHLSETAAEVSTAGGSGKDEDGTIFPSPITSVVCEVRIWFRLLLISRKDSNEN